MRLMVRSRVLLLQPDGPTGRTLFGNGKRDTVKRLI